MDDLHACIEKEIRAHPHLGELKTVLREKGFQEQDIDEALKAYAKQFSHSETQNKKNNRLFTAKELFDRVGYGFSSHQYINILFYLTLISSSAGTLALFLVGLFNGLKSIISANLSTFIHEYTQVKTLSKTTLKTGGIVFGFTFLVMAIASVRGWWWLFALSIVVGSIGVVAYGDIYNRLLRDNLKREHRNSFLKRISQYGVLITAAALLISGWLMEAFPFGGKSFSFLGNTFTAYGHLISFFITALMFIFSGYIISYIKEPSHILQSHLKEFTTQYRHTIKSNSRIFFSNKTMVFLTIATVLSGMALTLGNSYYGIFIYTVFGTQWLGGFLNVAVIYAVAVVVSLLGPWLTRLLNKSIGLTPMLVFGTLLAAMMPFFAGWAANLYSVGVATSMSILGATILGSAQGLLARKLLHEKERKLYFSSLSTIITLPYIILLPLGAWLAQTSSLQTLFQVITGVLVALVAPLYIILVAMSKKKKL